MFRCPFDTLNLTTLEVSELCLQPVNLPFAAGGKYKGYLQFFTVKSVGLLL